MRKKKIPINVYFLISLSLLLFLSFNLAFPFEFKRGENITIEKGETVDEDLYIRANSIQIDGTVNGDIWFLGSNVSTNGQINGSLYVICSSASLAGTIRGGIKVIGKDVFVSSQIGRDVFLLGSKIISDRKTYIGGDTIFAGNEVDIEGNFKNNIYGAGKKIQLNGLIGGETKFWAGELEIRSNTRIGESLYYKSDKNVVIFPGAEIKGQIIKETPSKIWPKGPFFPYLLRVNPYIWVVLRFFSALLLAVLFILLAPRIVSRIANTVYENPVSSILWGLAITIIVPFISIVSFVLVIGISVSIITVAIYALFVSAGIVGFEVFIGRLILKKSRFEIRKKTLLLCNIFGLLILNLLISVPVVGNILMILILIIGSGAAVRAFQGMKKRGEIEIRE